MKPFPEDFEARTRQFEDRTPNTTELHMVAVQGDTDPCSDADPCSEAR